MRTRWRLKEGGVAGSYLTDRYGTYPKPSFQPITSFEYMEDELHDFKSLGHTLNDIGGPMTHLKMSSDFDGLPFLYSCYNGADGQGAKFAPALFNQSLSSLPWKVMQLERNIRNERTAAGGLSTETLVEDILSKILPDIPVSNLDALGTTLINSVRPAQPSVDLATSVAELISEGKFFSLPGTGTLSGEWLNYNLAIAPLISVSKDLKSTIENTDKLLSQYERDAGRLVRRRYELPPVVETGTETSGGFVDLNDLDSSYYYAYISGNWTMTMKKTIKKSFSGAFTYPKPPSGWRRTLAEMEYLYGVKPGIDTAWELVPFSFVADYFTNMGDVLGNLNAFIADGLVMPYAYVTERILYEWDVTSSMLYYPAVYGSPELSRSSNTLKLEYVRRQAANPFGFGVDFSDLTLRQFSILAALGISSLGR